MGGSGFAIDMIRKAKANRALRKERINKYKERTASRTGRLKGKRVKTSKRIFKSYTKAEREALVEEIRKARKEENMKTWIFTLITFVSVSILIYWLVKTILGIVG